MKEWWICETHQNYTPKAQVWAGSIIFLIAVIAIHLLPDWSGIENSVSVSLSDTSNIASSCLQFRSILDRIGSRSTLAPRSRQVSFHLEKKSECFEIRKIELVMASFRLSIITSDPEMFLLDVRLGWVHVFAFLSIVREFYAGIVAANAAVIALSATAARERRIAYSTRISLWNTLQFISIIIANRWSCKFDSLPLITYRDCSSNGNQ